MIQAQVGAAVVEVVFTCINSNMGQGAVGLAENDHIAGDKVIVGGVLVGVLGHACVGFLGQRIQSALPQADGGKVVIVGAGIHAHFLGLFIDHTGVHALNVG